MSSICKWHVPSSVSVSFQFAGKSFTFSESDFPEFNALEANCSQYRIRRITELMNAQDPYASTPWALAQAGPNALVMGYIPIPFESQFQLFAQGAGDFPEMQWQPRNQYCPDQRPTYFDPDGYPIYGLGAIPSTARFHQRCTDPDCPDPYDPTCPTADTIGWMTTGLAACWKPKTGKPDICFPGARGVPFSWTDEINPMNTLFGEAVLINGVYGFYYPPNGQPIYGVQTTIEVTF